MVYLGYILPTQNQKIYDSDVALALANYQKDLLNTKFEKMPVEEQVKLADLIKSQEPSEQNKDDKIDELRNFLSNTIFKNNKGSVRTTPPETPMEPTKGYSFDETTIKISKNLTPKERAIASVNEAKEKALKRPLTPQEKIDTENFVENQGKLSASITSPTSTNTTIELTDESTIDNIERQLEILRENGATDDAIKNVLKSIDKVKRTKLIKNSVRDGKIIYGVRSGALKKENRIVESNILSLKDNTLIFPDGNEQSSKWIDKVFEYNLSALQGEGLRLKGKGVSATNGEKNFGNFHLSLPALRKGNLTIYRPRSNTALISRRNISPLLIKVINSIRSDMKFELDDYNHLKIMEQKVIDHIINLLNMDYPPKMKRALDEENWHLKQRYEILLSEINAGNGGYMVVNELKGVLAKLKENKVINKRKYDMIVSALN